MQEARRGAVNKVRALRGVYAKEAEALEAVHDVLKRFEAKQNCAELNRLRDVRQRHKEAQQRWSAKAEDDPTTRVLFLRPYRLHQCCRSI